MFSLHFDLSPIATLPFRHRPPWLEPRLKPPVDLVQTIKRIQQLDTGFAELSGIRRRLVRYLDGLDQFVLRQLRPLAYVRYVDDFLLFAKDKDSLRSARRHLQDHLDGLRLRLHDGKSRTYRTADGVTFLGWRLFPDHRRLVRGNVVRFRRRLGKLKVQYELGELGWQEVTARVRAWDAHAAHGDTWKLREAVFGGVLFHSAARATRQARGT